MDENTKATMHNKKQSKEKKLREKKRKTLSRRTVSRSLNQIALIFIFQRDKSQRNNHRQVVPLELSVAM